MTHSVFGEPTAVRVASTFEGLKLMERVLYLQPDLPIFQNKMYGSVESARNCPKGKWLVENETGLVNNAAFDFAYGL